MKLQMILLQAKSVGAPAAAAFRQVRPCPGASLANTATGCSRPTPLVSVVLRNNSAQIHLRARITYPQEPVSVRRGFQKLEIRLSAD